MRLLPEKQVTYIACHCVTVTSVSVCTGMTGVSTPQGWGGKMNPIATNGYF